MKPVKVLTAYQKKFIEDNYKIMTYAEIGHHLGLRTDWLKNYMSKNKMRKASLPKAKVVQMDNGFFNVSAKKYWL